MTGAEHYAKFCGLLENAILKHHHQIVTDFTNELYAKTKENVSMPHHSKSEMAKLGYPFARKDGVIKPHKHLPLWSVHMEYGNIVKALTKKIRKTGKRTIGTVGWFHPDKIMRYVLEPMGTEKMLGRPVLKLTAEQINLVDRFTQRILEAGIKGMMK